MFKRLVSNQKIEFYIDRDKVSMLRKFDDQRTVFVIDGFDQIIDINYENAILWLISTTPSDGPPKSVQDMVKEQRV